MCGDLYFRLMHKGPVRNKLICRFAINTSFIKNNKCTFTKRDIDPDSSRKSSKFDEDFKIEIFFKDVC